MNATPRPERERIQRFHSADAGKVVMTTDGDVLGTIERVRHGRALIRPTAGLLDGLGSSFHRSWQVEEPFQLDESKVVAVEEEQVVLDPVGRETR